MPHVHHVLNGDAMADRFVASGLVGDFLVWREALIDGPVAVDMSRPSIGSARAVWLASEMGVPTEVYFEDFKRREQTLAALAQEAGPTLELVLWFERDLFCEIHLLDLLGRTSVGRLAGAKVSVVHPESLTIDPQALADAFELRRPCTADERELARLAWRAWADSDARAFDTFPSAPEGPRGLELREGPWINELIHGMQIDRRRLFADARRLTELEAKVLELLRERGEAMSPIAIFHAIHDDPGLRWLGFGDLQVFVRLRWMAERDLLELGEPIPIEGEALRRPIVRASARGLAVLDGRGPAWGRPRGWVGGARCADWQRQGDQLVPWD